MNMNGSNSLGHDPHDAVIVEGITIRRCLCGMFVMLTPSKRIWWVKARTLPEEILSFSDLLRALASGCRYRRRPIDGTNAAPSVTTTGKTPQSKPQPKQTPPQPDPEPPPPPRAAPPLPPTLAKLQARAQRAQPVIVVKRRKAKAE